MSENGSANGRRGEEELLRAAPGLARLAVFAWLRTAEWSARTSVGLGTRMLRAAVSGEAPAELLRSAGAEVRDYARRLLGIVDAGSDSPPRSPASPASAAAPVAAGNGKIPSLRARGEELLRRSTDVHEDEGEEHPAYGGSSTSSRPTRRGSCVCCTARDRRPRSTCAPACPWPPSSWRPG